MKYKYFLILLLLLFLTFQVCYASEDYNFKANLFKHEKIAFNSSDLIKDSDNAGQYHVQILKNGKSIGPNQKVLLRINGVNYYRITDGDGVATLNINLNPGHYIVYSEFETFKNYNNVLVLD